jgi:integral membrane protein
MRNALLRYRVMAYVVGTLLVVLTCVGLPLKYGYGDDRVVLWTAIPHGWLYMALLITAFDLGRRAKWSWGRLLLIALAGTVPFLSFVAERSATKDVRAKLAQQETRSRGPAVKPVRPGAQDGLEPAAPPARHLDTS